jgi:hypothetical protein
MSCMLQIVFDLRILHDWHNETESIIIISNSVTRVIYMWKYFLYTGLLIPDEKALLEKSNLIVAFRLVVYERNFLL